MKTLRHSHEGGRSAPVVNPAFKLFSKLLTVFGIVMVFAVSGWGDGGLNDSCNGEQISELHAISVTTSRTETGTVSSSDTNDYYYFTPGVAGTLSVNYSATESTDFYIATSGCGNNRVVNNGTSYSNSSFAVTSTQTVYIRIKRESGTPSYSIEMTYTVSETPPSLSTSIPDQSLTVGAVMSPIDMDNYFTSTNGDTITYSLSGTLPTGLTFNASTGVLSGTPTQSMAATSFTVTATDNDGSISDSFLITVVAASTESTGGRNFTLRKDVKLYGDVTVIGNTVLCESDGQGGCQEPTGTDSNADRDLQVASSSYSTLTFPSGVSGENVKYARLYWQGRQDDTGSTSSSWSSGEKTSAKTISLRKGNSGAFTSVSADFGDFSQTTSGSDYIKVYSAGADVTDYVKANGAGQYYVQDLFTATGNSSDGLGNYGAWVLAVVYENLNSTQFKDIAIFDGYKIVKSGNNVDFNVSGFYTPKAPATVNSKLYVFAGEGDKYLYTNGVLKTGDTIQMGGLIYNTNYTSLGTMDSRIDVTGIRVPNLTNNNGIDIHEYNVGTASGGLGIITNSEKGARFRFTSDQDTYFPSVAVFSTDLYVPDICYDYAFSQNNRFFPHDVSPTAHIHGFLLNSEPLNTQIMFRNREAGTEAKNISIRIENINSTNQLEFYTNSQLVLQKTLPDSYYYNDVPSADITTQTVADLAFNWVTSTATLGYNESVFASFKLHPLVSGEIDVPLVMYVNYDYILDNQTYSMTNLELDDRVPRCVAAPTVYNPIEWIFNVVDGGLNPGTPSEGTTNIKYNLPTQVANRPVDIKVVSFDPNQLDRVKAINGMVAIEMIDVAGYLDTESSCDDPNSAITPRTWLQLGDIDQNVTTAVLSVSDFNTGLNSGVTATDFFGNVRENVAYRVSYNLADDNGSIKFDAMSGPDGTKYHLSNFPSYGGNQCASDIDGNPNSQDMVPQYCGDNGVSYASGMTGAEVRVCMECIYGLKTRSVCSRDNFSIRPEAFNIKIKDSAGSLLIPYEANLSAEYMYRYDVNATNHIDNNSTSGYTVWFNGSNPDRNVTLTWEPNGHTVSGCNDTSSPVLDFYFANGSINAQDRNHTNVGRYELRMRDSLWTAVDQAPITHHDNNTNWSAGDDCAAGSGVPQYNSANNFNTNLAGCTISSNHTKLSAPTTQYYDYNLTFKPHHFNPALNFSKGVNFTSVLIGQNEWTYMNDVHKDPRMGIRYSGNIKAEGSGNSLLNNFVTDCYAEPINIDLNLTFPVTVGLPDWKYRLQEINSTAAIWQDSNVTIAMPATNLSFPLLTFPASSFLKDKNGAIDMKLTLNFDRNQTIAVNPITIGLQNLQVKCQTPSACQSIANLNDSHLPDANLTTDANITHVYGRIIPRDVRVFGNVGFTANAWYEVFNAPVLSEIPLIPSRNGTSWYSNHLHDDQNYGDGNITRLQSAIGSAAVNIGGDDVNGMEIYNFGAVGAGNIPYSRKAHIETAPWLWYGVNALDYLDPSNANLDCQTHPCFNLNVVPNIGRAGSATGTELSPDKANKGTSTGTGVIYDYTPATR